MNRMYINSQEKKNIINRNIYGQLAEHLGYCIYGGVYVGEDSDIPNIHGMRTDVVEALRHIRVPVIRWPGGCFADDYHWQDGIGPKGSRNTVINNTWGGLVEDNSFGTHEFMELCHQIGCEPYISINVGTGSIREMCEWIEYMTFDGSSTWSQRRARNGRAKPWKVKYIGIGNECWEGGGFMRPEFYADIYRQYQTFLRSYGDNEIYKIACGPNEDDYNWTEQFMKVAGKFTNGISLHYYALPGYWQENRVPGCNGTSTGFDTDMFYHTLFQALRMEELVVRHLNIMDRYDPEHKVDLIVDEWGAWYNAEPGTNPRFLFQHNTMRDALIASMTLDIFNSHSDRISMANLAQTANVLQAPIFTDGKEMVLTPTYHVLDLYKEHQDANLLGFLLETDKIGLSDEPIPRLSATASEKNGVITLTVSNFSANEAAMLDCQIAGMKASSISGHILHGEMDAKNYFGSPNALIIKDFNDFKETPGGLTIQLPPCSVVNLCIL